MTAPHIGMVGLGRMGGGLVRRLRAYGLEVDVYDANPDVVSALGALGATPRTSLSELIDNLPTPKAVWVMVPAGDATTQTIAALTNLLPLGSTIIDGGNCDFRETMMRAQALGEKGIDLLDAGVSGGIWGADNGFCLMIGGVLPVVARLQPIFHALSPGAAQPMPMDWSQTPPLGYHHCGGSGAGHYVKMIHNAVEYGMMQAFAEGFDMLDAADAYGHELSLPGIAEVWRHGSVVRSWLLDLTARSFADDPALSAYPQAVSDSGEGRWAVETAVSMGLPAPTITAALFARFRSRQQAMLSERLLQAMRHQFGGHTR
jgi:6-phosphogluconate dehydrogenase